MTASTLDAVAQSNAPTAGQASSAANQASSATNQASSATGQAAPAACHGSPAASLASPAAILAFPAAGQAPPAASQSAPVSSGGVPASGDGTGLLAECRVRYLANMSALHRVDPVLATRLDAIPFAALPLLEVARDGRLTAQLPADDGRPIYLHSKFRPADEARALVEAADADDQQAIALCGLGLGYHLPEIERCFDRPLIIVIDDDLNLIKAALCCVDVARIIAAGLLVFITSADKAALHERLHHHQTRIMLGLRFISPPHTRRRGSRFQAEAAAQLNEFVSYARLQMMTILHNSRITCKNIANNLPDYVSCDGIDALRGRASGHPAIVVAAGPSLARALPYLKALRSRAVIVAVQTVFKPLLANDCPPHFVTSLDFAEVSANFFRGVHDVRGATLIAEPKATWHVLDAYPGRKRMVHSRWAEDLLQDAAPQRAAIKAGSTVAQLAFYVAQHLGCDPIILAGLDLAYSDGLYYAPGMPIERTWSPELGRYSTLETKQWERVSRGKRLFRVVKDIHGRDTYTDEQLFTYAQQFQADFLTSPAKVIHAGGSGMRLEGTTVMSFADATRRFCTRDLPTALFDDPHAVSDDSRSVGCAHEPPGGHSPPYGATQAVAHPTRRGAQSAVGTSAVAATAAAGALERRMDEVRAIRAICAEMAEFLTRLDGLAERPDEFNRVVVRVDELRGHMARFDRTYRLVVGVSPTAELRRFAADRRIGEVERETAQTARLRLARDRDFVAGLMDGCDYLLEVLPEAKARLERRT